MTLTKRKHHSEAMLVVCPAFNEHAVIRDVMKQLVNTIARARLPIECQVAVFDDGSVDKTREAVTGLDVLLFSRQEHRGYGYTLREGFAAAASLGFSHVLTFDTDGQHDDRAIPEFVASRHDADIVSGSRYLPESARLAEPPAPGLNVLFTRVIRQLTQFPITDVGCGMKLISTNLLRSMQLTEDGYTFPLEFWLEASYSGGSVREVPIPMVYLDPTRNMPARFGSMSGAVEQAARTVVRTIRRNLSSANSVDLPPLDVVIGVLSDEIKSAQVAGLEIDFPVETVLLDASSQEVPT